MYNSDTLLYCRDWHNTKSTVLQLEGLPWWFTCKESACNAEDLGSIPGSGRSPGEGNGHPLQYSCLENSMDGEAWWATVHGLAPLSSNSASLHDRLDGELEGMWRGES